MMLVKIDENTTPHGPLAEPGANNHGQETLRKGTLYKLVSSPATTIYNEQLSTEEIHHGVSQGRTTSHAKDTTQLSKR